MNSAQRAARAAVSPRVVCPVAFMLRAVLCATHDRTSDAETSRRTRVDADWKAAMGVDDEFTGIAPTTFSLFRARLVLHDAEGAVFERTVERAVQTGVLRGKVTAIIDSSPVAGAGAVADTYELVRGFIEKTAKARPRQEEFVRYRGLIPSRDSPVSPRTRTGIANV